MTKGQNDNRTTDNRTAGQQDNRATGQHDKRTNRQKEIFLKYK